jgi:hypothetical protein
VVLAQPKKVIKIQIAKKKQQQPQLVVPRQTQVSLSAQVPSKKMKQQQRPSPQATAPPSHSLKSSLATASAIARDPKHPKREQAEELVRAYQRGWIDAIKFNDILQQLVF